MRRVLIVVGVLVALVAGGWATLLLLASRTEAELAQLDVSDEAMAARYHPPGTACVRYAGPLPGDAELDDTTARLLALGLTGETLGAPYAHLFALEQRREATLHAQPMAEEYLAEFERSLAGRPLQRLVFEVQRPLLRSRLDVITSTANLEASGAEAWAALTPAQQEGLLSLLQERPRHFQPSAYVRLVTRARAAADASGPPTPTEDEAPSAPPEERAPCPPLPHVTRLSAAEYAAVFDAPEEASLLRDVRLVPAAVNGRFEGFRLSGLRPGSRVAQAGFCNGDRVIAINGEVLGSPGEVLKAMPGWKAATRLEIDLFRAGQPGVLVVEVRPAG